MKRLLLIVFMILLGYTGFSQESSAPSDTSYWKKGGLASLTFTQVSLSKNWAAGGVNSWSVNGLFTAYADYRKNKVVWKNSIEMGFGLINQEDPDPDADDRITEKTDDRLNIITDFGYKLSEKLSWSSVLDFRTQFVEGEDADDNRISEFFSPAYLIIATGLKWNPNPSFSLSYSPVGGKFTFVMAQSLADNGAYGVKPAEIDASGAIREGTGKNMRAELGSFVKASFEKEIVQNVTFDTRVELFYNYNFDGEANFNDVDVNWQNLLVMKVNDFLTVNWQTQLIYDRDVRFEVTETNPVGEASGQFKSVFGVGLAYKFGQSR